MLPNSDMPTTKSSVQMAPLLTLSHACRMHCAMNREMVRMLLACWLPLKLFVMNGLERWQSGRMRRFAKPCTG